MTVEFADEPSYGGLYEENSTLPIITTHEVIKSPRGPIKILNRRSTKSIEPVLRTPIVKQGEDGKIEIISEVMETEEIKYNPIKDAVPVETNVFPCNHCERSFPLRQLLDIHVANHVRDRKFHCENCQKGFFSKYDLGKHILIHTGEKPFKCVVCEKAFSRSTLLRRHEKVHSDQPKFLCAFCEHTFLSKEEWEKHMENHQKKRPFECEICGKSFAFKQGLERHEVVHSEYQPYQCEHCDQGFSTQGKLARHLTAHAGERPYPCRLCDKSYLLSHHLTRHMRSHKENNQTSHKCSECDLTFSKRVELIMHSAIHSTENLSCVLCKETFDNADEVTEHIKLHADGEQYACEFCDLIFISEGQLHDHSENQHLDQIEYYDVNNGSSDEQITMSVETSIEQEKSVQNDETFDANEEIDEKAGQSTVVTNLRSYGKTNNKPKILPTLDTAKGNKQEKIKSPKVTTLIVTKTSASINSTSPLSAKNSQTAEKKLLPTRVSETASDKNDDNESKSSGKKTTQTPLTKFISMRVIKTKPNASSTSSEASTPAIKKLSTNEAPNKKSSELSPLNSTDVAKKLGDQPKIRQIKMTKAQIDALTKEGKIQLHEGKIILKQQIPKKK